MIRVDFTNGRTEDFAVNRDKNNGPASKIGTSGFERAVAVRFEPSGSALYVADFGMVCRRSGQVMQPIDGMAFIGRNPLDKANVYVVTGDSGNGMTHGTVAGLLLTDLIQGRENVWQSLYDPGRITLKSAIDFLKENVNVAAQYAKGYAGPGEIGNVDEIAANEGGVLGRGLREIAAYRDERGALHERSAVCPHLGCIVAWNSVEKTWDCPCHGSRFDCHGKVMNGPANQDLEAAGD